MALKDIATKIRARRGQPGNRTLDDHGMARRLGVPFAALHESLSGTDQRFAALRDGRIDTGMRVRKLPKILETPEALRLLELTGFDAAEEFLAKKDPREQELYVVLERARARLRDMTVNQLVEARDSKDRLEILRALRAQVETVIENVERVPRLKSLRGGKSP